MIRWLRVVLPAPGWPIAFLFLYGCAAIFEFWLQRHFEQPFAGITLPENVRWGLSRGIWLLGTVCYAAWRALSFHPLYRPAYHKWLTATPWTSRKPLPFGPLHLVPQDVVLVGAAVILAFHSGDTWVLHMPALFLCVYLVTVGVTLFFTGAWPWGYAAGFALGFVVLLWRSVPACAILALLTYVIAYLGLRESLTRFPWETARAGDLARILAKNAGGASGTREPLGWPFGRLAPRSPDPELSVPRHHALLISLLAGWLVFASVSLVPTAEGQHGLLLQAEMAVVYLIPACRLVLYCDGYWPPLTVMGRLATGRWLIPAYDQVLVAPLLAVLVGSSPYVLFPMLELNPLFWQPVMIAVSLFISLGMGPSLKVWRLTGGHRIGVGLQRKDLVKVG